MRSLMFGADCTRLSRMIASCLLMLAPVAAPNFCEPRGRQEEGHRVRSELALRRPGVLEVAARDDGLLPHGVERALAAARPTRLRPRGSSELVARVLGLEERRFGRRARLHQRELEERGVLDQVLDPLGIVDARQLDEDAVLALAGDQRLRHAELVDAVADRLDGLRDGVVLDQPGGTDPSARRSTSLRRSSTAQSGRKRLTVSSSLALVRLRGDRRRRTTRPSGTRRGRGRASWASRWSVSAASSRSAFTASAVLTCRTR